MFIHLSLSQISITVVHESVYYVFLSRIYIFNWWKRSSAVTQEEKIAGHILAQYVWCVPCRRHKQYGRRPFFELSILFAKNIAIGTMFPPLFSHLFISPFQISLYVIFQYIDNRLGFQGNGAPLLTNNFRWSYPMWFLFLPSQSLVGQNDFA